MYFHVLYSVIRHTLMRTVFSAGRRVRLEDCTEVESLTRIYILLRYCTEYRGRIDLDLDLDLLDESHMCPKGYAALLKRRARSRKPAQRLLKFIKRAVLICILHCVASVLRQRNQGTAASGHKTWRETSFLSSILSGLRSVNKVTLMHPAYHQDSS